MTDVKHNPLPWGIGRGKLTGQICVQSDDAWICSQFHNQDDEMSKEEAEANAQFIVTACNSHYELVEVANQVVEMARDAGGIRTQIDIDKLSDLLVAARNALAKMKT